MSPAPVLPITTSTTTKEAAESPLQRWTKRFHEAESLLVVLVDMIADRDSIDPASWPREAQRRTAEIRRTVAIIEIRLEILQEDLSSLPKKQQIRRKELRKMTKRFEDLSSRVKVVAKPFTRKRSSYSSDRNDLLGPDDENCTVIDINSAATASMENSQIVQLQRDVMKEQDADLDRLEKSIASTKHIAVTINKELDLHTKLIDDLDEHTEETSYQLHRVQKQLKSLSKRIQEGGSCVYTLLSVIVIIVFVSLTQH